VPQILLAIELLDVPSTDSDGAAAATAKGTYAGAALTPAQRELARQRLQEVADSDLVVLAAVAARRPELAGKC
jgi:hypothetical protein